MPPHLHPRSRMTSSLFATTVAASFLVVGVPHILPCPAPRVAFADASSSSSSSSSADGSCGQRRARRRSPQHTTAVKDGIAQFDGAGDVDVDADAGGNSNGSGTGTEGAGAKTIMASTPPRAKRECPVPKPGGVIGELIGFGKGKGEPPGSVGTVGKSGMENNSTVDKIPIDKDR